MKKIEVFLICVLLAACAAQPQRMGVTGGNSFSSFVSNAPQITPTGAEPVPCISGGVTKQCTTQNIANLSSGGGSGSFNPAGSLINIKDPRFGATGNGTTDDTAAIQAAIDYAYEHNIQSVFCPSGNYKISPNASWPNADIYLDAPGNLRSSNWSTPSGYQFSLSFVGQDEGIGNANGFGCTLQPTSNSNVAFIVGSGQHMRVAGIAVIGPNNAYRGNLNSAGVGIGIAGGSGGAHHTIIENTLVENFYALYETDANGACCLADSNSFIQPQGTNGYIGIDLAGEQAYIDRIDQPVLATTIGISDLLSKQTPVTGGNLSPYSTVSSSFGISSISGLSAAGDGGFTFTAVVASPDTYWPNVYNSFTIVTSHFGVIPLTLSSWNSGTDTATFEITPQWATANFGRMGLTNTGLTAIAADIAAVSTVYAAERVTTVLGMGVSLRGTHIENPFACETLYSMQDAWSGSTTATLSDLYYNFDPALSQYAPANSPTAAELALFYCQQTFPFIFASGNDTLQTIEIDGGDFGQGTELNGTAVSAPLLIQVFPGASVIGRHLHNIAPLNEQVWDLNWYAYTMLGGIHQIETQANGAGDWDNDYFLPDGLLTGSFPSSCGVACYIEMGHLTVPFKGYRPAQGQEPNLSPDIYSLVSGSLGGLGTYPPIDCETVYHSVGYESGALTHVHLRSASCPGYSWGQNLTNSTVGETVTWSFKGRSAFLYLDAKTLSWMFPGLGFTLSGGSGDPGSLTYVVTGVYPQLGYVTAMSSTDNSGTPIGNPQTYGGAPLGGGTYSSPTTVYSCSSSCTIGQTSYSWTQY